MNVRLAGLWGLWCLVACNRVDSTSTLPTAIDRLRGTWRVVSYTHVSRGDTTPTYPFGLTPRGYLVYDHVGHVFFQALRPGAIDSLRLGLSRGAPKQSLYDLIAGYHAYFGTYTVDTATHSVTHRIEGELPVRGGSFEVSTVFRVTADSLILGTDSVHAWHFVRVR